MLMLFAINKKMFKSIHDTRQNKIIQKMSTYFRNPTRNIEVAHIKLEEKVPSNCQSTARFFAKTGQWTLEEKEKYLIFLLQHIIQLRRSDKNQSNWMFRKMSRFISSRKSNQCKLYHTKMLNYYNSSQRIIKQLSSHIHTVLHESESRGQEIEDIKIEKLSSHSETQNQKNCPNNEVPIPQKAKFSVLRRQTKKISLKMEDEDEEEEEIEEKQEQIVKTDATLPASSIKDLKPNHRHQLFNPNIQQFPMSSSNYINYENPAFKQYQKNPFSKLQPDQNWLQSQSQFTQWIQNQRDLHQKNN